MTELGNRWTGRTPGEVVALLEERLGGAHRKCRQLEARVEELEATLGEVLLGEGNEADRWPEAYAVLRSDREKPRYNPPEGEQTAS